MATVPGFSKLTTLEARAKCNSTAPPPYFRLQADLKINMSMKRWGADSAELTTTEECFDDSEEAATMLALILDRVRTPRKYRSHIIGRLSEFGRRVAGSFEHKPYGSAYIVVDVMVDVGWPFSAAYRYVLERSAAMVPATEEAVERVRVEGNGDDENGPKKRSRRSNDRCSICLEDFWAGSEASTMPCSHVFHEGCVLRWLKVSHYCPLCRFKMPTRIS